MGVFSGAGDGEVSLTEPVGTSTWEDMRSAIVGDFVRFPTAAFARIMNFYTGPLRRPPTPSQWILGRIFFPFNTGAVISASATITACTFNGYCSFSATTDGRDDVAITQSTIPDENFRVIEDYDEYDALDDPDEAGPRLDCGAVQAISSEFNATGLSWIKKAGEPANGGNASDGWTLFMFRGELDIDNIPPIFQNRVMRVEIATAEAAEPDRPTLTVIYTTPPVRYKLTGRARKIFSLVPVGRMQLSSPLMREVENTPTGRVFEILGVIRITKALSSVRKLVLTGSGRKVDP
jgi:hypothetical protein